MPHKHHSSHPHHHSTITPAYKRKAILIAVFGAIVVLSGVWLDHLNREVLLTRDQASNYWSYFHQKSIKERIYESELAFADELSAERVSTLTETVARYQVEGNEIRAQAEEKEVEIVNFLNQIKYTEVASILFELAIILVSVSIIVPLLWLETLGMLAAIGGLSAGIFGMLS